MVIVPAYAKVNLALEVVARRSDGYHDLRSVVVIIDWHDLVGVGLSSDPARASSFHLTGPAAAAVPVGAGNLAVAAADHLRRAVEQRAAFDVWLDKRLPVAAGLGGGSADAAAVLRAGVRLLESAGNPPDLSTLRAIAARLGSDVPALLQGGASLVGGRGDELTPLRAPELHFAVAVAGASSTASAYAALGDGDVGPEGRADELARQLAGGQPPSPALLGSSLEAAACRASPALGEALARLRAATPGEAWHLTGSGGAAFVLAADAAHGRRLAGFARAAGFAARACRSLR